MNDDVQQGRRTNSKSGVAQMFATMEAMAYSHLGESGGMLPRKFWHFGLSSEGTFSVIIVIVY